VFHQLLQRGVYVVGGGEPETAIRLVNNAVMHGVLAGNGQSIVTRISDPNQEGARWRTLE